MSATLEFAAIREHAKLFKLPSWPDSLNVSSSGRPRRRRRNKIARRIQED